MYDTNFFYSFSSLSFFLVALCSVYVRYADLIFLHKGVITGVLSGVSLWKYSNAVLFWLISSYFTVCMAEKFSINILNCLLFIVSCIMLNEDSTIGA